LTKPAGIFDENFDHDLFDILKNVEEETCRRRGMPPYIIFHDSSLKAMATHFPQNPSDLQKINGVGEIKVMKYGNYFLKRSLVIVKIIK